MLNTYKKYCLGVFVMESESDYSHGDTATIQTRYGKEIEVLVWKLLKSANGKKYYSIVRLDGKNTKEFLLSRSERFKKASENSLKKSSEYHQRANKDSEFLSLGEPIKVGHHSEKRHRKMFDQADSNMGKAVDAQDKAKEQALRSESAERRADGIFLDTPDCINDIKQYIVELEESVVGTTGFVRTNRQAKVKYWKARLDSAIKLWEVL